MQAAGLQLGDGGEAAGVVAAQVSLGARVVVVAQQIELGGQLGQPELHVLVIEQRLSEHLALADVLDGAFDGAVHGTDGRVAGDQEGR